MLGNLLKPEFEELIQSKDYATLREAFSDMDPPDIAEVIEDLPPEDSGVIFRVLPRDTATQVFEYLPLDQQSEVVETLGTGQMAGVLQRDGAGRPDPSLRGAARRGDQAGAEHAQPRRAEDRAAAARVPGGQRRALHDARVPRGAARHGPRARRSTTSASTGRGIETLNVIYVTDDKGVLLDDLRLPILVLAKPEQKVSELNDAPAGQHPRHRDARRGGGHLREVRPGGAPGHRLARRAGGDHHRRRRPRRRRAEGHRGHPGARRRGGPRGALLRRRASARW